MSSLAGIASPSGIAAWRIGPGLVRRASRPLRIGFSWSRAVIAASILPEEAAELSVTTLRPTIPTKSTPSTAIQARPRVIRTIRPESGSWPTATAVRPAKGISWPPTAAARLVVRTRREARAGAWRAAALRPGALRLGDLRAGALRAGAAGAATARPFGVGRVRGRRAGAAFRGGGEVREGAGAGAV